MDATREFFDLVGQWLDKSDIYEAQALGRIATALLRYRTMHDMNQSDLARHLGVSQGMVSRLESGESNISVRKIAELCEKLGLSMELKLEQEERHPLDKYIPTSPDQLYGLRGKGVTTDSSTDDAALAA